MFQNQNISILLLNIINTMYIRKTLENEPMIILDNGVSSNESISENKKGAQII